MSDKDSVNQPGYELHVVLGQGQALYLTVIGM